MAEKLELVEGGEPKLFGLVDPTLLTEEWREIAPVLDVVRDNKKAYVSEHPDVAEYALFSSAIANAFATFPEYSLGTDFESFFQRLKTHEEYYDALTGLHGARGRTDSMLLLAGSLGSYVDYHEERIRLVGSSPDYKKSKLRLRASLLEEAGRELGDIDLLDEAIGLNLRIKRDSRISDLKRYKIHAAFSRYDIADFYMEDKVALSRLKLPKTPERLQSRFHQTLYEVCDAAIVEAQGCDDPEEAVGQLEGLVPELIFLGYLRGESIENNTFKSEPAEEDDYSKVGFSQSFPHQDRAGLLPRYEAKQLPNGSFDIFAYTRDGEHMLGYDIKKGSVHVRNKLPHIQQIKLRLNGYGGVALLEKARDFSEVMTRKWLGDELSEDDSDLIDEIYENLDIRNLTLRQKKRLGRVVIHIA